MSTPLACATCAVATLVALAGAGQSPGVQPPARTARVALTFDDLPAHGPLPPGVSRVDVAKRILDTLQRHQSPPTYGFINARALTEYPDDAEVLRMWRAAGHPLGNHAFSHMDLHANGVEAFQQDVLANEASLQSLMGNEDWHWFRYPYLREGDTAEKHRAVLAFLREHGYKVAQVTLTFDDYAYNDPYARCLAKNDAQGLEWLKESYLTRASESLARGRQWSRELYGRDIKHVMLLHIGAFQMVMLSPLLDLLKERGFVLTTLPDAQADAAYAIEPALRSSWQGPFLQQMLAARGTLPPAPATSIFEKLGTMCR